MKTFMPKQQDVKREWWVVDATDIPLGRLASQVAAILRGKNKPTYTPHADMGDNVIVINCDKVALTGDKLNQKFYKYHTLYPGGDRAIQYKKLMAEKSDFVVEHAVKGMLPKNRLSDRLIDNLYVFAGAEHDKQAQQPKAIDINALN